VSEEILLIGKYFLFTQNNVNVTYTNLAPIGCALSGGIGAKNKNPNRWVVVILGDGGFNMALEELNTIFNSNFKNLLIIVFNNSAYGAVYKYQMYRYKQAFYTTFKNPNYSEIVKRYLLSADTVKRTAELSRIIKKNLKNNSTALINIIIDKNEKLKINKYL
jgi:acetolactate synthase-1/2/3 large subunit